MGGISKTGGKGSGRFVEPIRVVCRWTASEVQKIRDSIENGYDLDETAAQFPNRSWHSVKDQYYKARAEHVEGTADEFDEPAALSDARRQKDAIEGSAKLKEAIERYLAREFPVSTGKAA
jgi:hypothetical protein